ncbi:MAG: sigma-54-dependent Fis family transcriptional regulator [Phycisphaerae bacterium]|nr:sigma-54-dependent Fis family transcriptional regulator [Phycisphaerae bacterium]
MMDNKSILVVDDEMIIRDSLCEFLKLEGYHCNSADSFKNALVQLEQHPYNMVITDVNMPEADGFELLRVVRKRYPDIAIVVITGYGTIESAIGAIKAGAFNYLTKPIVDDEIRVIVSKALEQQALLSENKQLKQKLSNRYGMENIIGTDYKMLKVFDMVEAVAQSKATVLLSGQSGTGKSIIARAIHQRSDRMTKPFVELSCGSLPETLLESELFGHVKGSFTGAASDKQGKFLSADGGTLFLDEINSATPGLQMKLLRVIQERQFEPVGSNETKTVDVRLVLATNRDLQQQVREGKFREDLYYRINVVNIDLPSLAQRITDVPVLAEHFLQNMSLVHGREKHGFTEKAMAKLEDYHWPGNVRELENVVERAVVLSTGYYIDIIDLPPHIAQPANGTIINDYSAMTLKQALEEPEKRIIEAALKKNNFNRQATADTLGINRTTLYKKMKSYQLDMDNEFAKSQIIDY